MRIAIIGGGWAGLAAAVRALDRGHLVTLLEMAPSLGGRARTVQQHGQHFDNGQHILIGAYTQTLALMRQVGADPARRLRRLPLSLTRPDGTGLALTCRSSAASFAWAVLRHSHWHWRSRLAMLKASAGWAARGFECPADWTVEVLTKALPLEVRQELVEPLCVAALNTPAQTASARVFLRVLKDALMQQVGGSDLLLPVRPLNELLPEPGLSWLRTHGADIRLRCRAHDVAPHRSGWMVDTEAFDQVILACPAQEAARLTRACNPAWSAAAAQLTHSAITTVYLTCAGARLARPMVFLPEGPAQFAFDHRAMGLGQDRFAFVISAADDMQHLNRNQLAQSVLDQALHQFPAGTWPAPLQVSGVFTERRATFRCEPTAQRPAAAVAPGLWAAGDYVEGPYPSTLEGAVRSGQEAADLAHQAFAMQNRAPRRDSP